LGGHGESEHEENQEKGGGENSQLFKHKSYCPSGRMSKPMRSTLKMTRARYMMT
jgi:hypothetical protein